MPGSHHINCNNVEKIPSIPYFEWFDITCLFVLLFYRHQVQIKYVPGPNICIIIFIEHGRRLYWLQLTVGLGLINFFNYSEAPSCCLKIIHIYQILSSNTGCMYPWSIKSAKTACFHFQIYSVSSEIYFWALMNKNALFALNYWIHFVFTLLIE